MDELRKIYCEKSGNLPSIETVGSELTQHDRIRIDYNINSRLKRSRKLRKLIEQIDQSFNVEIHKGHFKKLEFYNIYNLFSIEQLDEVSVQLENAVKSYKLTCERLIKEFKDKYDYSFSDPEKSFNVIRQKLQNDENKLSKNWIYRFHGGDVCFSNSKTGQVVDINLKFGNHYGVLDLWFFQYFMETTDEYKSLSSNFKDNTPKLIQTLNILKKKGKLKLIESDFFDPDKLIWFEEKADNTK